MAMFCGFEMFLLMLVAVAPLAGTATASGAFRGFRMRPLSLYPYSAHARSAKQKLDHAVKTRFVDEIPNLNGSAGLDNFAAENSPVKPADQTNLGRRGLSAFSHARIELSRVGVLDVDNGEAIRTADVLPSQGVQWKVAYFNQRIDHFSFSEESDSTFFSQKYIFWDAVWSGPESGGPIFVYCGNEGPVEWFLDNAGFITEIAVEFGALVVGPEHRYYGESQPFGSAEAAYKDVASRAYLTTEQAMADMAILLTHLRKNLKAEHCPIVVFGGSYGGMLAAWFRLKYPHIAIGAIASSAPILQYENVVPHDIFYRIVSRDFLIESRSCFEYIRSSWEVLRYVGSMSGGLEELKEKFGLCKSPADSDEVIFWLEETYSSLAMVDYPVPSDFLMPLPANPIREVCRRIDSLPEGSDVLDRIAAGANVYYNFTGTVDCFDTQADPHGEDGWNFQACSEQCMPMASNSSNSMFEPFEWNQLAFDLLCLEEFGVMPRPSWILTHFGGRDIKQELRDFGSNIVFSNGELDPWSGGSVLENISETIVSITIPDGAHHLDLRASTPADPSSVVWQREVEKRHIRQWLDAYWRARDGQQHVNGAILDPRVWNPTLFLVLLTATIAAMLSVILLAGSLLLLFQTRVNSLATP